MRVGGLAAERLKTLWVSEHLAPLLGQGGERRGEVLLSGHTHLEHLLGFLVSRHPAQGRQAKRNAYRILGLAHPVLLGHTEKRFDGIRTDRQPDVIKPEGRGGLELEVQVGSKLLTQRGRGHGVNERLALGAAVV